MKLMEWILKITRTPRTIAKGAGAYGAIEGIEYLQSTNAQVANWFEHVDTFQSISVGIATVILGTILADKLYNVPAGFVNKKVGGPLL